VNAGRSATTSTRTGSSQATRKLHRHRRHALLHQRLDQDGVGRIGRRRLQCVARGLDRRRRGARAAGRREQREAQQAAAQRGCGGGAARRAGHGPGIVDYGRRAASDGRLAGRQDVAMTLASASVA
jgi:hypothetical protein